MKTVDHNIISKNHVKPICLVRLEHLSDQFSFVILAHLILKSFVHYQLHDFYCDLRFQSFLAILYENPDDFIYIE